MIESLRQLYLLHYFADALRTNTTLGDLELSEDNIGDRDALQFIRQRLGENKQRSASNTVNPQTTIASASASQSSTQEDTDATSATVATLRKQLQDKDTEISTLQERLAMLEQRLRQVERNAMPE